MLSELEKNIVRLLQEGLPLTGRPFLSLAQKLGITEDSLIEAVENMMERGIIRRFGALVKHRSLGYTANSMVVWKVPPDQTDRAGMTFSGFPGVSHCYRRKTVPNWHYNIYTMIHGHTENECLKTVRSMSAASGISDYQVLFSTKELKKTSMKYFVEE